MKSKCVFEKDVVEKDPTTSVRYDADLSSTCVSECVRDSVWLGIEMRKSEMSCM